MPLHYQDLLDIIMQRADRIGLVDNVTKNADAAELELYMFHALLSIVELVDLNDYTVRSNNLASTTSGKDTYALPDNFGRLIATRVRVRRGIYVNDTAKDYDLEYVDPNVFKRNEILLPQRPSKFTVIGRDLLLAPIPDSNGANNYRIHGVYIEQVSRPDLDDVVKLPYPTALIDEAIYILAGDMGRMTESIAAMRAAALIKLGTAPGATPGG